MSRLVQLAKSKNAHGPATERALLFRCLMSLASNPATGAVIDKSTDLYESLWKLVVRWLDQKRYDLCVHPIQLSASASMIPAGQARLFQVLFPEHMPILLEHLLNLYSSGQMDGKEGPMVANLLQASAVLMRNLSFLGAAKQALIGNKQIREFLLQLLSWQGSACQLYASSTLWSLVYNSQRSVAEFNQFREQVENLQQQAVKYLDEWRERPQDIGANAIDSIKQSIRNLSHALEISLVD